MEKKKIVIIGGGTAGASAACLLQTKLGKICDIEILASKNIPIVGVGEATVGNINEFLEACDLNPEQVCLGDARGTIKYAVHLKDWYKKDHSYFTPIGLFAMDYQDFIDYRRPIKEYWESWSGLKLGLNEKSPFLKQESWDTNLPKKWREYAFHIDADLFGEKLLDVAIERGATLRDVKIKDVKIIDGDKIDYLTLENGERIEADFFIDCSGFKRLVPNACGYTPIQFNEDNKNNRAWATRIDYSNKENELPYLSCIECQTMDAGWRWQIGLRDRIGTGYVFSTDYISEEDALQEFKNSFEEGRINPDDCNLIKFNTECYEKQAGANWLTCGLSSGFVEPLESTSIFFMHNNLMAWLSLIKQDKLPQDIQMIGISSWEASHLNFDYFFDWNRTKIDCFNKYTFDTFEGTVNYIGGHYAFNDNNKSKYWNDWKTKREKYIKIAERPMNYKDNHLFFSRPGYSLLAMGNAMGKEIPGWDLSHVFVTPRQQEAYDAGELKTERDILEDRTINERLLAIRGHLGRQLHKNWMSDLFMDHAYDIIDQYKWLDICDSISEEEHEKANSFVRNLVMTGYNTI